MKIRLFIFIVGFLALSNLSRSMAQNSSVVNDSIINVSSISGQWMPIVNNSGVIVYARLADCNRPEDGVYYERVLLKLVNTTSADLMIEWKLLVWYDGVLWTRLPVRPENRHFVPLSGGASTEGMCGIDSDYYDDLTIFVRFLNYTDKPVMSQFQFLDFNVSPQLD